jgi:hypothetical protein
LTTALSLWFDWLVNQFDRLIKKVKRMLEPMTSYSFLAAIPGFAAADWRSVEERAARTFEQLDEWDAAWGLIVALGLDHEARPAMDAAREAGAELRLQALAGAACAAVAARGQIGERRFRTLYRPFAKVLPADPEVGPATALDRMWAHCPVRYAWH